MKILVGMSGGVDSSVAALLLKKEGHDVTGVTMKIWRAGAGGRAPKGSACYGPEKEDETEQIKKVCDVLGIEHRHIDCAERFERAVLDYFKKEYRSGRTPNPCVRCNQEMKFGVLPVLAKGAGISFDRFATGHYARTGFDTVRGRWLLMRGADGRKDQSYFLYRLSQEQLAGALFPLGGMTKDDVRKTAEEAGLPVHDRGESSDFYGGDYADMVGVADRPGDIVESSGAVLGRHRGVWHYTVGQRKGLGVAFGEPLYVLSVDAESNRVVVGTEKETKRSVFTVRECSWSAWEKPGGTFDAQVKIRSATPEAEARVEVMDKNSVKVHFMEPRSGITPGQSAVFYGNDIVLGGGIIDTIER